MHSNRYIWVKTQFEHTHSYPEAPEAVAFLRNPHRHMFGVEAKIQVFDDDRELEFIMVKRDLDRHIRSCIDSKIWPERVSCEMLAANIGRYLAQNYGQDRTYSIIVSEDGENGAQVVCHRDEPMEDAE